MISDDNLEKAVEELDNLIEHHYLIWTELGYTLEEKIDALFSVFLTIIPKCIFLSTKNKKGYNKIKEQFIDLLDKEPYETMREFYKELATDKEGDDDQAQIQSEGDND